ncbi:MAG: TonB-dependent receptor domain-containing protein [Chitinophagaceae bacterium]
MKLKLILLTLVFATKFTNAQITKISGLITSDDNKAIAGATVYIYKYQSNKLLKTGITEVDGSFEIVCSKLDSFYVECKSIGWEKYTSTLLVATQPEINLTKIILKPTLLNDVTVSSQKKYIERKLDRVIINPNALITNAGSNVIEALEKAPGVMVNEDGLLKLKGSPGVMVFIDDKPTQLSGADLANYLKTLTTAQVESIELMTNPPAKYDAAGNAGIINIKLKKNTTKGFNGSLSVGYGQGFYARSNNSFAFNYRINKFNFFSNINYSINNSYQDLTINRSYFDVSGTKQSAFNQNTFIKKQNKSANARIGVDYYASKKTTIGIAFSGFNNPSLTTNNNKANILDGSNNLAATNRAFTNADKLWKNGAANFNFNHKTNNKGGELSGNFDYVAYNAAMNQSLVNTTTSIAPITTNSTTLNSDLPASLKITSAKIDFSQPTQKGARFEAGIKTSFVNTDNTANFYDVVGSVSTVNNTFSNRFKYKENINAGYLSYSCNIKKLSVQAGLRYEYTNVDGKQLGNAIIKDSSFSLNYGNLFPTIFAGLPLDSIGNHYLSFSYGRRIERPNYQDMNPFTYPMDNFTFYSGNPFLQPTIVNKFELAYTLNNKYTFTANYNYATNVIFETNEQVNGTFYSRPGNFGKQIAYGLSIDANVQPAKWWVLQGHIEANNFTFTSNIYGQNLDRSQWYWAASINNTFILNKSWTAELSGNHQSSIAVAQFITIPVIQARIGIAKKIMKDKATLKLTLNDIFWSNRPGGEITSIANATANWRSILDTRVLSINFSYRFSKGQNLKLRKTGASETETQRIKV